MTTDQIIALVLGVLGAGGIGGAIWPRLPTARSWSGSGTDKTEAKKVVAEATSVLQEAYETRIKNLTVRTTYLEQGLTQQPPS